MASLRRFPGFARRDRKTRTAPPRIRPTLELLESRLVLSTSGDPSLTLTLASHSIPENAGAAATTGTVTRNNMDTSQALTVNLQSSNTAQATVPSSVVIPAGATSVTFNVNAVDDHIVDAGHTVTITATAASPIPAGLDATFGSGGYVSVPLLYTSSANFPDVKIQSDGKIVAVAASQVSGATWAVSRSNANGTLDTSFGTNGTVVTTFAGSTGGEANGLAIQPDGKIVVVGIVNGTSAYDAWGIARYNTDGTLDTTFGSGGLVLMKFSGEAGWLYDAAILSNGDILVGGMLQNPNGFAVARLTSTGQLDTSFGTNGIASINPDPSHSAYNTTGQSMIVQPDGKILMTGIANFNYMPVVRFNADGTPDTSFNGTGVKLIPASAFGSSYVSVVGQGLALQSDGKIIVTGHADPANNEDDWATARLNPDGSLDTSFDGNGLATIDFAGGSDIANDVTVMQDGKIIVAGRADVGATTGQGYNIALARYNSDGTLDTTFNGNGKLIFGPLPSVFEEIWAVDREPDGKLAAIVGYNTDMRIARFDTGLLAASDSLSVTDTDSIAQPSDPGFELPNVGSGYLMDPANSPWTFSGSAGVAGNNGPVTSGNPAAPQGTQVAWMQNGSTINQAIAFNAGTYYISFEAAQRGNYPSNSTIQVQIDGQMVGSITPTGTSYAAYTTNSFTVTAGSHTVQFVGVGVGGSTALLDQVSIQSGNPPPPPAPPPSPPPPPPGSVTPPSDPGFELPNVGNSYLTDPTGSPWKYISSSGVAGNGSPVTSGNPAAPQGTQVAWVQNGGTINQAVSFGAGTYYISLEAAQRGNYPSSSTILVQVDQQTVGAITPSGTSYAAYTTGSFTVEPGSHIVQFVGEGVGGSTALLDAVSIQSGNPPPPPAPPPSPPPPPPGSVTPPSDPGFETPNVGSGWLMDPASSPWTFSGNAGVAGNGSAVTSGNPNAPQGTQVAWAQNGGTISQAVSFGAGSYTVSFEAAQRGNYPSNSTIQVQIDGQTVGSITPTGTSYASYTTGSFMVTAGNHTLGFVSVSNSAGSSALIDQVSIGVAPAIVHRLITPAGTSGSGDALPGQGGLTDSSGSRLTNGRQGSNLSTLPADSLGSSSTLPDSGGLLQELEANLQTSLSSLENTLRSDLLFMESELDQLFASAGLTGLMSQLQQQAAQAPLGQLSGQDSNDGILSGSRT
jgi:uncharacterized delta-60 repeat protein